MKARRLKSELRQAKASELELDKLVALAEKLDTVTPPGLSAAARQRIANRLPVSVEIEPRKPFYLRPLNLAITGSVGALVAVTLVISTLAQSAVPGSPLYNVKRSTDELRSLLQPEEDRKPPEVHKKEIETQQKKPEAKPDTSKQTEDGQSYYDRYRQQKGRFTPNPQPVSPSQNTLDAIREQAEATRRWSEAYKRQLQYQTDSSQQYLFKY